MALNDPWEMDVASPVSNSNFAGANVAENCAPSGINNAIRQAGAWIAQATSHQSAALSSSVSTNIAATGTGLYIPITGANAINSFGSVAGVRTNAAVLRILEFSSSASLSHGTTLILRGAASRRTQPGDVGMYIHEGTADVWRELFYSRTDGGLQQDSLSVTTITNRSISTTQISTVTLLATSASITTIGISVLNSLTSVSASVGSFGIIKYGSTQLSDIYVQVKTASTAASASTSSNIPYDTSIPQNSEGANIFSVSITPRNASSILEVEALVYVQSATAGMDLVAALFLDNAANAIQASTMEEVSQNPVALSVYFEHTASTTTEHVYALRYGADSGVARLNHGTGGNLGGVLRSWMRVKERLP